VIVPDLSISVAGRKRETGGALWRSVIPWVRLGFLAAIVYGFAAGPVGFVRLINLYREEKQLKAEERRITAEVVQLENIRRYLESDTTYIEQIAREDYGLSRPGEVIYLDTLIAPGR
jgi:cell division protein FtsB